MTLEKTNILIVDDEANILNTMEICLKDAGYKITTSNEPQKAIELIQEKSFDIAFVDLKMEPLNGLEVLKEIKFCSPETTVIIMTAHGSVDSAIEAIKQGAYHYLQKPFDYLELQVFTEKTLQYHRLKTEVVSLRHEVANVEFPGNIITRSSKMREMISLAEQVAQTNLSVLIEGESGTGKELFAQLIFNGSERNKKPFVKINCAALAENLLENELFGHVKGAFTGAINDRVGRFEMANGGTIFLDEIAELSPALQAKLLRVLQSNEFERLGESVTKKVDVRVIAATNKNLEEAIKEGVFREDLFYRLNAVRLKLIPLRERPEDITLLTHYFIKKFSAHKEVEISFEALKLLRLNRWSGNVRELENTIERTVLLSQNESIAVKDLPGELTKSAKSESEKLSLEEVEKNHIKKILHISKDLAEASEILGIDPATLWRKRKKYGL
ncbi:MAG: sigma-54-dependent Fis family transcriptional regulator [Calditrichaeota bacterium]|nr:MAG: sigma-54-dependent Fis family transcriptional regulator [Calditrichota bacterium]MBL1204887.1 sigma-54-dependent Fis family transcriptional regulator [Calditrichota bacterium]NOG44716.1 sigma-54-dependent Fis family transcriptional regulator [Calditrichota bacterium]